MPGYTTADLISTVKLRGMIPDASAGSLSSQNILQLATEELQGPLVSLILSARENYYETYSDVAITANQSVYPMPQRAAGGIVSALQYVYQTQVYRLMPLEAERTTSTSTSLTPRGYFFQNNNVVLDPPPNTTQGSLRFRYFQRPSRLELTSNCAQIVDFDAVAMTVTVGSIPANWTTGMTIDFVPQNAPYTPYGLSTAISGTTGSLVSVATLPANIAVGDWLALSEFTPIPEVPYEFFPVLAQATICKLLEAIGDRENLQFAQAKLQAYEQSALKMITPRDQGGLKKVVSNWRRF